MKIKKNTLAISLVILLAKFTMLAAGDGSEKLIEEFRENFKKEYFSVGIVLQAVSDFQIERNLPGNNGFSLANTRLTVSGELDKKFGYLVRTNFVNSISILDAKIHYRFSDPLTIDFGQFKSSFSKEFLTPVESIYFVNRSRAVTLLVPGRQIGLQLRGQPIDKLPVTYALGVFNGNGTATNSNDNNNFLYAGRLLGSLKETFISSIDKLEMGVNAAYSRDSATRISEEINPFVFEPLFFDGERVLLGADLQINIEKFMISGEYINGEYNGTFTSLITDSTFQDISANGFHLTAGYTLNKKVQLLARLDNFNTNRREDSNWIIGGVNYWPTLATEFQFNYILNAEEPDLKYHQFLINVQVAL